MMKRRLVLMVLGVLIGVGLGGLMYKQQAANTVPVSMATAGPVGAPLLLQATTGKTLTTADFGQKPALVFFGFTHCPSFCPSALTRISNALQGLTPAARAKFDVYFVTVDPKRDTLPVLKDYLANFDPQIIGLTGTPGQIATATQQWKVYASESQQNGNDYTIDHSTFIYLVGPDFNLINLFKDSDNAAILQQALAKL